MVVKLLFNINMRNGDKKNITVEEKEPKGYLVDKKTGDRKEISLTDKEVQAEYSRKIFESIEQRKPMRFLDIEGEVHVINSYDVSSITVKIV